MDTLRIMTFNMRTYVLEDGKNHFFNRSEFIKEKLEELKPDVIGCQEIQPCMQSWMTKNLTDYTVVGGFREKDFSGESACIAFRRDKFVLYDCETFWLSPTPHTPGTRHSADQSIYPRVCTWVTLLPAEGGTPFRVYNVHTDHLGVQARLLAGVQLLQKIDENNRKYPTKSFLTGDFNERPDCACIQALLNCREIPLKDLTETSGQTFHDFGRLEDPEEKIDYIFADRDTECIGMQVIRDSRDGLYLSDHYPILAEVRL